MLGPQLEALARERGVRVRRIELRSWHSEVATTHGIRKLPTLVLYDGERRVSSSTGAVMAMLARD